MMGPTLREIMNRRWSSGYVFPYLASIRTTDRATYFARYCKRTGIGKEVTLHCYRYAVAERMHAIGFNHRFSKALLGHSTDRNHYLYSKGATVQVPCLETSEVDFKLEQENGLKLLPNFSELKEVV
jgi:integrase